MYTVYWIDIIIYLYFHNYNTVLYILTYECRTLLYISQDTYNHDIISQDHNLINYSEFC